MEFHDGIYFKFFPENLTLKGFKYSLGLNTDIHPFNPKKECFIGGLYYTDIEHILNFKEYGSKIGIIKIPKDVSIIKVGDNKYKSHSIYVESIYDWDEFCKRDDIYPEEKIKNEKLILEYCKSLQTPEICLAAVTQNGYALQFVNYELRTPEICLAAVTQNGYALQFVNYELQTPEICLAAVTQSGNALRYVNPELQTLEICIAAVTQNGYALEYVNPELHSPEIFHAASKQHA